MIPEGGLKQGSPQTQEDVDRPLSQPAAIRNRHLEGEEGCIEESCIVGSIDEETRNSTRDRRIDGARWAISESNLQRYERANRWLVEA